MHAETMTKARVLGGKVGRFSSFMSSKSTRLTSLLANGTSLRDST